MKRNCLGCGKPTETWKLTNEYCDDCIVNDRDVKASARPWDRYDDSCEEQENAVERELFLRRNTVPNVGGGDR